MTFLPYRPPHIAMRPYKPYMVTPHYLGEGLQYTWHPWSRRTVMSGRMERIVVFDDRLSLLLLTRRQKKQDNRFFTTMQNRHIHEPFAGGSAFVKPPINQRPKLLEA